MPDQSAVGRHAGDDAVIDALFEQLGPGDDAALRGSDWRPIHARESVQIYGNGCFVIHSPSPVPDVEKGTLEKGTLEGGKRA